MKRTLTTIAVAVAAAGANAKTLALWPTELGSGSDAIYGTNAISTASGIALVEGSSVAGPDWALPSNPDASGMVFSPLNGGTAVAGSRGGSMKAGASAAVPVGNGFFTWNKGANMPTIEGTEIVDDGTRVIFR